MTPDAPGPQALERPTQAVGIEGLRRLQEHPDVAERISHMLVRTRPTLRISLERSRHFVPMIERVLQDHGVPRELAYLPMVESRFRPHAVGRRALGLWQFTRSTARLYGLEVSGQIDERRDPEKSTRAAARYLRDLYDLFGRWDLALAAYNAGPGRVLRALARRPDASFFELAQHSLLPPITRVYVPEVLAISLIGPSPESFGLQLRDAAPALLEAKRGRPSTTQLGFAAAWKASVQGRNGAFDHTEDGQRIVDFIDVVQDVVVGDRNVEATSLPLEHG